VASVTLYLRRILFISLRPPGKEKFRNPSEGDRQGCQVASLSAIFADFGLMEELLAEKITESVLFMTIRFLISNPNLKIKINLKKLL
jgi:hypothetical protein